MKKIIFSGIAVMMLCLCGCGRNTESDTKEPPLQDGDLGTSEIELSARRNNYPSNIVLGQSLAGMSFKDKNGMDVLLAERLDSDLTILCYWGSWCSYCKEQLAQSDVFANLLEREGNVTMLLVDKLDPEKESIEAAESYLEDNEIPFETLYDEKMEVYNTLGMKVIPTTYFLDGEGRILFCHAGPVSRASQLESMLSYVRDGYALATEKFIREQMLVDGGMKTNINVKETDTHPFGDDVLSESQGLLMEYAVGKRDQELFDLLYEFLNTHMYDNGLYRWYYSEEETVNVNALLDDLRIYHALEQAQELWGGYEERLEAIKSTLVQKGFGKKGPIDFFDGKGKNCSGVFSLCYGDLKTIEKLYPQYYELTKELIDGGYISDDFPLYYASYSYDKKRYSTDSLHTAEAMYTLLHLAETGGLRESTAEWLRQQLRGNGIMAGYQTDGAIAEGKGYESTGIYAIVAMTGMEIGDDEIVTLAIARMENARIFDSMNAFDGAFGNEDGTEIYSFDQCMGLLANQRLQDYISSKTEESDKMLPVIY